MQQTQPTPKKMKTIKVPRVVNGVETEVEIEVEDTGGAGPKWGPNEAHQILNKPLPRVDGPLKVTGTAKYTYDVRPKGMLFGRILTSPHAHAKVKSIDLSGAKAVKGAFAVEHALKQALHEGAPVAAVAAPTPELAEDALRAIKVEWEVLDHVVEAAAAMKPGAPKVFPDDEKAKIANNVRGAESRGEKDATTAALDKADVVVEAEYRTPMQHHVCLEPHGITVDYRGGDEATVYASTQGTHTIPGDAAKALGLGQSKVLSVVEHMGGGFGAKFGIGVEGQLACKLAKEAKAPVRMMLTRQNEFLFAGNRSGSWQKLKGGASKDGTLVALLATQYRLGGIGNGNQAGQPYIYTVATSARDVAAIHTNEDSSRAFRAPGHPQASYAIESLIDDLAHKLAMDPLEMRKKNLKDPVYHRQLDRGAKEIGWERRNKVAGQVASGAKGPVKRGIGCAVGQWGGGGSKQCVVTVNIARDGAVSVLCGSQDLGTGTRTYMRAIVAEELGLQIEQVNEELGRSNLGSANASGGSTTAASLAPAVKHAAYNARAKVVERVAPLLGAKPDEVTFAKGNVSGGGKSLGWKQACAALPSAGVSEKGEWQPDLAGRGVHGACFAEVEVDTETGHVKPIKMVHVQDVGLPLNRTAIESQINGGMIQSLGQALYEGRVMDAELGVMLNPNMEDYKIPGSLEMPEMVPIIDDADDRQVVIGVGEPALIPAVGALANAVFNAIGVRIHDLPITPDKVLMALQTQGSATKEGSQS
ncbi:MAG TPA: xanthine dehydrogenase family protein molybdopterin-binding subunit [Tepidisphaeraceae bacterium]|nr:xanthine dehydrogenase family protein molybdopterin-binding subunit [Tepidisphaeraceae bacterium]